MPITARVNELVKITPVFAEQNTGVYRVMILEIVDYADKYNEAKLDNLKVKRYQLHTVQQQNESLLNKLNELNKIIVN